ncbi:Detected protein of confused Function [Hibiscus syriacus]|uniref:Detected protein of confused Function n=1 Tax=Hibiscus syriacus TaxID=106335 RepID=A0A6A3BXY0_HIBSY|nr:Detected protein of confused Function [Hibiscus syriacus]
MSQLVDKAKNFVAEKVADIKKPEADVTDVDLKHISYTFKSAGREISSGTIPDPGSLKADDTTMLGVAMKVPYNILLSLARDIGGDWDIDYELGVGLTVDLPIIGNSTIPLSKKGEIKLPALSDIF